MGSPRLRKRWAEGMGGTFMRGWRGVPARQ
jgi:hypothetical protein